MISIVSFVFGPPPQPSRLPTRARALEEVLGEAAVDDRDRRRCSFDVQRA